jgi:hypothetical protein
MLKRFVGATSGTSSSSGCDIRGSDGHSGIDTSSYSGVSATQLQRVESELKELVAGQSSQHAIKLQEVLAEIKKLHLAQSTVRRALGADGADVDDRIELIHGDSMVLRAAIFQVSFSNLDSCNPNTLMVYRRLDCFSQPTRLTWETK